MHQSDKMFICKVCLAKPLWTKHTLHSFENKNFRIFAEKNFYVIILMFVYMWMNIICALNIFESERKWRFFFFARVSEYMSVGACRSGAFRINLNLNLRTKGVKSNLCFSLCFTASAYMNDDDDGRCRIFFYELAFKSHCCCYSMHIFIMTIYIIPYRLHTLLSTLYRFQKSGDKVFPALDFSQCDKFIFLAFSFNDYTRNADKVF